jgi:hypothetical protein
MAFYYIKKYGKHELHKEDCVWLPIRKGMVKLGSFETSEQALHQAQATYNNVKPCPACCKIEKKQRAADTAKS